MENTVEKRIEKVAESFTKFRDEYSACKYLYIPETNEEREYLKNSTYFKLIKIALFRNSIIELCKIIKGSKNNYFNIFGIIKSLKKRTDLNEINLAKLNNIESKIKETTDLTERIINLRNDFIAHTKLEKEDPEITFDELDNYILNFEEIIKLLFSIINNSHFEYSPILFNGDRFHIISILAKDKADRLKSISDILNSRKKNRILTRFCRKRR